MTSPHQHTIDAALTLPEAERTYLVERLLDSIAPDSAELTEEEFTAELERRRSDIEQGFV